MCTRRKVSKRNKLKYWVVRNVCFFSTSALKTRWRGKTSLQWPPNVRCVGDGLSCSARPLAEHPSVTPPAKLLFLLVVTHWIWCECSHAAVTRHLKPIVLNKKDIFTTLCYYFNWNSTGSELNEFRPCIYLADNSSHLHAWPFLIHSMERN